jgi:Ca2+-transporting ATPase
MTSTPTALSSASLGVPWQACTIEETLAQLNTNPETGLSREQVAENLEHYGSNELVEQAGRSSWQILLDQFTNIMLILLIVVALVSGILDFMDLQKKLAAGELPFKDTIAILAIVILNGLLGLLGARGDAHSLEEDE